MAVLVKAFFPIAVCKVIYIYSKNFKNRLSSKKSLKFSMLSALAENHACGRGLNIARQINCCNILQGNETIYYETADNPPKLCYQYGSLSACGGNSRVYLLHVQSRRELPAHDFFEEKINMVTKNSH